LESKYWKFLFLIDSEYDSGEIGDESIRHLSEALKANASLQRVTLDFTKYRKVMFYLSFNFE